MSSNTQPDYDVIGIGAGFAGLALIHYAREAGLSVHVFDKADDIGGTWTWNRYPGAASDSECYYYCLTFSKELLQEWRWSVRYPSWDENLSYMHFVADRCDMWPHITLNTEISRADYDETAGLWRITTAAGETCTCRYFVSAMGMISEPVIPNFKGMDRFKGPCFLFPLAAGGPGLCGQARWDHRQRRHHRADAAGDGGNRGPCDRFPAHGKLRDAGGTEANDAGVGGGHQGTL